MIGEGMTIEQIREELETRRRALKEIEDQHHAIYKVEWPMQEEVRELSFWRIVSGPEIKNQKWRVVSHKTGSDRASLSCQAGDDFLMLFDGYHASFSLKDGITIGCSDNDGYISGTFQELGDLIKKLNLKVSFEDIEAEIARTERALTGLREMRDLMGGGQ